MTHQFFKHVPRVGSPKTPLLRLSNNIKAHIKTQAALPNDLGRETWTLGDLEYLMPPVFLRNQWVYKITQQTDRAAIVAALRTSLKATLEQCRPLAGILVKGAGEIRIVRNHGSDVPFISKEPITLLSFETLKASGFPSYQVEELAALGEMDNLQTHTISSERPILQVQTTWIPGGLILTVGFHHYSMDGVGFANFLKQWRTNHVEMEQNRGCAPWHPENLNRDRLNGKPVSYKNRVLLVAPSPVEAPKGTISRRRPIILHFHRQQIEKLKLAARRPLTDMPMASYNAITALLWRVHTRTRLRCIETISPSTPTALSTAVDLRRRFEPRLRPQLLANACMGVMSQLISFDQATGPGGLAHLASLIGETGASVNRDLVAARADEVAMLKDKTMAAWTGAQMPAFSFAMTDMREAGYYELDFGFGAPTAVRNVDEMHHPCVMRQHLTGTDANGVDKKIEVQMPVEEECLAELMQNQELLDYAEVVTV